MLIHANINGEFRYPGQAMVPVNDLGLLRGYGVFEYLRTYNKKPFRFDDYLDRLRNSANELSLPLPTNDDIKAVVKELIRRSELHKEIGIRFLLTGGTTTDGASFDKPTFVITAEKLFLPTADVYQNGVKLITHNFQREMPHVKTTNYLNALKHENLKVQKGGYELLYYNNDNLLETSRNNFFLFNGEKLITPKKNILIGITRNVILELAGSLFEIEEREIKVNEINDCSEAFITGTIKKIVPVVKVNDYVIEKGNPGENTLKLMKLFNDYVNNWGVIK